MDSFHALYHLIITGATLTECRSFLLDYKQSGGDKKTLYQYLEQLRKTVNSETEDRILEIMDIVSGFCSKNLRVWDEAE